MFDENEPEKINDTFVYHKLLLGQPLTAFELGLILDNSSVENVVKLKYDNLLTNIELEEYFKEKQELKMALAMSLQGIIEYMQWQQEQKAMQAQYNKVQQEIFADLEQEKSTYIENTKDNWLEKLLESMLPKDFPYADLESRIRETAEKSNNDIDMRTIKAVLELAKHSDMLRNYLFPQKHPEHDNNQHCQLMLDRILDIGNTLKNIKCHQFMNQVKNYLGNDNLENRANLKIK